MNILLINQYATVPSTGMGGRTHYFARELAKRGHAVTVVSARFHHLLRGGIDSRALPERETVAGYTLLRIPVPTFQHAHDKRRIAAWFLFAFRLWQLGRRLTAKQDVVLVSSPSLVSFLGAEQIARHHRARLVTEVRDIWPLTLVEVGGHSPRHPLIRFMQWIEDRAYRISDRVVSNLPFAIDHMVSRGMAPEKFSWIPNGYLFDEAAEQSSNDTSLQKVDRDTFVVSYTGSLGKANALDVLIEAARLIKDYDDIIVQIVGKGKERIALEKLVKNSGLINVRFVDEVPKSDVQGILKESDALYLGLTPSPLFRFGVSPNKLFDYLAAARPIIYAIDSGKYRPVEEMGAGIQVPPGDSRALAAAILFLRQMSPEERGSFGQNGRNACHDQYNYASLTGRLESVLTTEHSAP